ncbi:MAG: kynureninase, partial [Bacteroidota bacterium]
AEAWQLSNAPVLMMAAHKASLDLFAQTSMQALREKSLRLTGYLEFVLNTVAEMTIQEMELITPKDPAQRGCQISMRLKGRNKKVVTDLAAAGVIVDWREPDTIRLAPVPLYNSFEDVYRLGEILIGLLG